MLAEVAKQKGISLCGIRRDQITADFPYHKVNLPDAILLASDLSQAVVTGALTKIKYASPHLSGFRPVSPFCAIACARRVRRRSCAKQRSAAAFLV